MRIVTVPCTRKMITQTKALTAITPTPNYAHYSMILPKYRNSANIFQLGIPSG